MPKFQRRHYTAIAAIFAEEVAQSQPTLFTSWEETGRVIERMCAMFERDNPRFNRDTFVRACKIGESAALTAEYLNQLRINR